MTQRVFDIENEKDMQDLWDILPDNAYSIKKSMGCQTWRRKGENTGYYFGFVNINWHDKTEITRPIQEATEQDIGKLCMFSYPQEDASKVIGILRNIKKTKDGKNCYKMYGSGLWYIKCRRLTKQEIEELC